MKVKVSYLVAVTVFFVAVTVVLAVAIPLTLLQTSRLNNRMFIMSRLSLAYQRANVAYGPPRSADDLAPFYEGPKVDAVVRDVRNGLYVFVWGTDLLPLRDHSKFVLGYERDVPARGGVVVLGDGSAVEVTVTEFNGMLAWWKRYHPVSKDVPE